MIKAFYIKDLIVRFGSKQVLAISELTLPAGAITALIGPSGAGKSTFLRTLNMLQKPTMGQVEYFGEALFDNRREREYQRSMTMVLQKPTLFSGTVQHNVELGLKLRGINTKLITEKVYHALSLLGIERLAKQPADTLSGGEAQRVALARALVLGPKVLLLDEPTASLDPANVRILEELIKKIHQELNNTIIVVTHNFYQAKRLAHHTIFLDEGKIIEHRPTAELFTKPEQEKTRAFLAGEMIY